MPADHRHRRVCLDATTMLTVMALAERYHATPDEMAAELIHDGIAARTTRAAREHVCRPGEINTRFCRVCSAPLDR